MNTWIAVKDKKNCLIGWFANKIEAYSFIKRNDPKGLKGFYVKKSINNPG